ncbi:exodeoxyribonuclease VII small subunit [Rhodococcus rhodnii]|uniref:Exodeoxyribonuclease 7 small subunit n=2 Tax=Rhodococcus rhodnii TaxID=38312 RepID=R7WK15_9NOCA|nr:exodeoxyribonuclease VII small subunit [Rhodococcus rhodnii]EOM75647.1 exodeoxyribonuclease VII small subunit [Rhodococcus rhodnii LMG 5362]TXG91836.1 exodeoxyribonuclease VII small subunit [Rhodococcus rhodnii]
MSEAGENADRDEPTPVAELGYEAARDELVDVVRILEHGGLDLDASLALWERGEALATRCEEHLAGARKRVEDAIARTEIEDE